MRTVCAPNTLSKTKASGKIVVCDRGVVNRIDKSAEVKRVGGKGMVLANLTEGSTDADTHAAPTVHLNAPSGPAVKAYAKKAGATATLKQGNLSSTPIRYPQVASFSSRGPSIGNAGDLLKPDISAPGRGDPGRGGTSVEPQPKVRLLLRHLHGLAARFGCRGLVLQRPSHVVTHGGEVGDHDHLGTGQDRRWQVES